MGLIVGLLKVEVKMQVVVGDPKEKICEVVAEQKAVLLIMGCRAFGPLKVTEILALSSAIW